jgi:hypothetical protein
MILLEQIQRERDGRERVAQLVRQCRQELALALIAGAKLRLHPEHLQHPAALLSQPLDDAKVLV